MAKKFVLFAMQRTGSNMAVQGLSSHPSIQCFGELLRKNNKDLAGALRVVHNIDPIYKDEAYRFEHTREFIDSVYALETKKPIVGFKLMLQQHPEFMDEILRDPSYSKIVLHRHNIMAVYSSQKIAHATGQGIVGRFGTVKSAKIDFKENQFMSFWKRHNRFYADLRDTLSEYGEPFLDVEYRSLVTGEGLSAMFRFLGVDPDVCLQIHTKKRNPSNILKRFNNPEKVKKFLKANDLDHWLRETLGKRTN